MSDLPALYIDEAFRSLRGHKRLADGAMAQLSDAQFFAAPSPESNSVAIIVKHLAGNMRSRFTDFLTSDGEKPDRNRDREFVMHADAKREEVLSSWEQNWELVFQVLNSLHPEDLTRTVTIRGEPHSVLQAINRQVVHYAYHVGQIVFLAKHWKGCGVEDAERSQGPKRAVQRRDVAEAEGKIETAYPISVCASRAKLVRLPTTCCSYWADMPPRSAAEEPSSCLIRCSLL